MNNGTSDLPLVSIIITNYNYGRFLRDAIESALDQTYPNIEVIVVDDGSADNSREIIAEYGERIVPVLKENGGQASALNAGFAISKGEVVVFLDADDWLLPEALQEVVNVWCDGISKVQYRLKIVDNHGVEQGLIPNCKMPSGDIKQLLLSFGGYPSSPTSGNAFARSFLNGVFPIPESEWRMCADDYLNLLSAIHGNITSLDQPLGFYRIHGSNNYFRSTDEINLEGLVKRIRGDLLRDYRKEKLLQNTLQNCGEVVKVCDQFVLRNLYHVRARLALLRMAPEDHPFPNDTIYNLVYHGFRSSIATPWLSPLKRMIHGHISSPWV